jgi:L-threonylcarbamoyladenylate synthase
VQTQLGEKLSLIIDGGQAQVGIESTVLDLASVPPHVLRPGMVHEESLASVLGQLQSAHAGKEHSTLRSPGLLKKHYSPKAKLRILSWCNDAELRAQLVGVSGQIHVIAHSHIPSGQGFACVSVIPHDVEAFARAIYAELHRCDETGAELIVVEAPPETAEWRAISDRLKRAAAS